LFTGCLPDETPLNHTVFNSDATVTIKAYMAALSPNTSRLATQPRRNVTR
jgi:hypothetical protein